jgi:hypothetical protein
MHHLACETAFARTTMRNFDGLQIQTRFFPQTGGCLGFSWRSPAWFAATNAGEAEIGLSASHFIGAWRF